jgi:hypothetical protein
MHLYATLTFEFAFTYYTLNLAEFITQMFAHLKAV